MVKEEKKPGTTEKADKPFELLAKIIKKEEEKK